MRIIFSRKGFDSSSGGKPSPIVGGRPISLPIPASRNSVTSYGDLGMGELVHQVTRGRLGADSLCHADPWFAEGQCAFGQTGSAQGHLSRHDIGPGDVFLFFGLFADEATGEPHHRIYGYMAVEQVLPLGPTPSPADAPIFAPDHPHFIGERDRNNTLYLGPGGACGIASPKLRLTQVGGPLSTWAVPEWLARHGLTYHDKPWRWPSLGTLLSVARGQEFICDVGDDPEALAWLAAILVEIGGAVPESAPDHDEVIITMLRQPYMDDPNEKRSDPFWEFGSFGTTGCHQRNLLNPRRAHELAGKRLAFAQGGPDGFRLVHLTPPISVKYHGAVCELQWPAAMPLAYEAAPVIIDNAGHSDFPALLEEIEGVARRTFVAQFASKFRSRRQSVPEMLAAQLIAGYEAARGSGARVATCYTDALPYLPPKVDTERKATYRALLRAAGGVPEPAQKRRRC